MQCRVLRFANDTRTKDIGIRHLVYTCLFCKPVLNHLLGNVPKSSHIILYIKLRGKEMCVRKAVNLPLNDYFLHGERWKKDNRDTILTTKVWSSDSSPYTLQCVVQTSWDARNHMYTVIYQRDVATKSVFAKHRQHLLNIKLLPLSVQLND